jgi:hypothetical protein
LSVATEYSPLLVLAKLCELRSWALLLRSTGDIRPERPEHGPAPSVLASDRRG